MKKLPTGVGLILGMGAGLAVGIALDHISLGIVMGLPIGFALEMARHKKSTATKHTKVQIIALSVLVLLIVAAISYYVFSNK